MNCLKASNHKNGAHVLMNFSRNRCKRYKCRFLSILIKSSSLFKKKQQQFSSLCFVIVYRHIVQMVRYFTAENWKFVSLHKKLLSWIEWTQRKKKDTRKLLKWTNENNRRQLFLNVNDFLRYFKLYLFHIEMIALQFCSFVVPFTDFRKLIFFLIFLRFNFFFWGIFRLENVPEQLWIIANCVCVWVCASVRLNQFQLDKTADIVYSEDILLWHRFMVAKMSTSLRCAS